MRYETINNQLFIGNRQKFVQKLKPNSLAVFNSNDIMPTNADGTMPFRQNNDLFWLSGVDQEESILVIFPDCRNENQREILFLKETSKEIAIWEGAKLNKNEAHQVSGIRTVYWREEFEEIFTQLIKEADNIYLNSNEHLRARAEVETRDVRFIRWCKEKCGIDNFEKSALIMHELRAIKTDIEIQLIQHACNITEKAFRRVLNFVNPGVMEHEIEAEITHEFLVNCSRGHAYEPIIASGFNACVLHYVENNKECKDGDVLLMDFGAEYANYASDMTRSIPVSGRFTQRQKDVYNAVLRVMKETAQMLRPGTILDNYRGPEISIEGHKYHKEVGKLMESELVGLGLLDKADIQNQDPANLAYKRYFMHGTSHYLGLDVHDVGFWDYKMKAGMVFTCEPGIYIREENLGIRLENDLLVTDGEPIDLMKNIPIEVEEIEELMNAEVAVG